MTDDQKLDLITDAFIRAILANKMEDKTYYKKLLKRVVNLIRVELAWQKRKDWERDMMQMWGPNAN